MNGETLDNVWMREDDMPERWVEAHKLRRTRDICQYGPINIPPIAHDCTSPLSMMPAPPPQSTAPPLQHPKTIAVPPNRQPFPLWPPPLSSYTAPLDDRLSVFTDSQESSDEELSAAVDEMLANQVVSSRSHGSQSTSTQRPGRSRDTRKASPLCVAPATKLPSVLRMKKKGAAASLGPERKCSSSSRKKTPTTISPGMSTGLVPRAAPPFSNTSPGTKPSVKAQGKRKADPAPAASPPAKRNKARPMHVHPRKHDEFWYLDGNIIVQIQDTRFRLHRSRLTLQSEFFEELFDRKDGPGNIDIRPEMVDGHPLYVVSDVNAEDFANILRAMDDAM